MRPYVIGGACDRVHQQVENAMVEGVLTLPAPLLAHVERCPHCSREVREVETLLKRLRSLPASLDLGPVPPVVDRVLQAVAQGGQAVASAPAASATPTHSAGSLSSAGTPVRRQRPPQWRWILGQVAAVAAALAVAAGGLTLLGLRIHRAVVGISPGEGLNQWFEPLREWTQALFRNVW